MGESIKADTKVMFTGSHSFYDVGNVPGVLDEHDIVCYRGTCKPVSQLDSDYGELKRFDRSGRLFGVPISLGTPFKEHLFGSSSPTVHTTTTDSIVGVMPNEDTAVHIDKGAQVLFTQGHSFYDVGNIRGVLDELDLVCYQGRCGRVAQLDTYDEFLKKFNGTGCTFSPAIKLGDNAFSQGASVYTTASETKEAVVEEGMMKKFLGGAIKSLLATFEVNKSE